MIREVLPDVVGKHPHLLSLSSARTPGVKLASPDARIDSDNLAKHTGEMRLIRHSAVQSDLRKRHLRAAHDDLRATHTLSCDIGVGSLTEAPPEGAKEVANAELHDAGEIGSPEVRINVGLDVGGHAFRLPGGEAAPQSGRLNLSGR